VNSGIFLNNTQHLSFPSRIILIGFMGSGKSTVGKLLATSLDYQYLDTDTLIEKQEAMSVADIFAKNGEAYFRALESGVVKSLNGYENTVIATGGGMPVFENNMDLLRQAGVTVFLQVGVHTIYDRISKDKTRPLVTANTEANLKDFIKNKLQDRIPFYKQAQVVVAAGRNARLVVHTILNKIATKKQH
jgi:shikimate kinase